MAIKNLNEISVAIIEGKTPQENFLSGIAELGGIDKFFNEVDSVFINFTLRTPSGIPNNSNLDLIEGVIKALREKGVENISIGTYPIFNLSIRFIDELMDFKNILEKWGAKFMFLDNSDNYQFLTDKQLGKLESLKSKTIVNKEINETVYKIPKVFLNSDKFILLNQVNAFPLFDCALAIYNQLSLLSPFQRDIHYRDEFFIERNKKDQYKQDILNKIFDIYNLRTPDIAVNDLFYTLEDAGPNVYKDSKLNETRLTLVGTDLIALDKITLKILNLNLQENPLFMELKKRGLDKSELSEINILGKKIEEVAFNFKTCKNDLSKIKVQNLTICKGDPCSGCFLKAYHLLNFLNTYCIKDSKYLPHYAFLTGLNPEEPNMQNVILFGDCVIKSTKNYDFQKKVKKTLISKKEKKVKNDKVIEISGCPPDFYDALRKLIDYFGKTNMPNLRFYLDLHKSLEISEIQTQMQKWEEM